MSSIWDLDVNFVRNLINQRIMEVKSKQPAVDKITDVTLESSFGIIPLRIYSPSMAHDLPIILLIHGGAWVAGSLDTHDYMARYICSKTQVLVVSVGYLTSPEGKFPEVLEQCYEALLWTIQHANEYSADPKRLAIVGDSSGGNMATALCRMSKDRNKPSITFQVLINPAPDLTTDGTIEPQDNSLDFLRWQATQYIKEPQDVYHPYVSPMHASNLSGLPSALILLAENDSLRSDGQKFADRLKEAGVPTNLYIQWEADHLAGNGARASEYAHESLDIAVAALKGAFRKVT